MQNDPRFHMEPSLNLELSPEGSADRACSPGEEKMMDRYRTGAAANPPNKEKMDANGPEVPAFSLLPHWSSWASAGREGSTVVVLFWCENEKTAKSYENTESERRVHTKRDATPDPAR